MRYVDLWNDHSNFFRAKKGTSLNPSGLGSDKTMRLTISNVPQPTVTGAPTWTRVYRWGDRVGTLRKELPWNDRWNVEVRRPVHTETGGAHTYLLESTEPLSNAPLPLTVDDAWEEEVVPVAEGVTWNRALVVTGSPGDIERVCAAHRLPLSAALLERLRIPVREGVVPDVMHKESLPLTRPLHSPGAPREGAPRGGARGGSRGRGGSFRGGRGRGHPR